MVKDKTVIVSDLHIDTWNNSNKIAGRSKMNHFLDFLEWIEPFTCRFIINGDLLDAPARDNGYLLPDHHKMVSKLVSLTSNMKVFYFVGNHDISFWGLKVNNFRNLHVMYPYYPYVYICSDPFDHRADNYRNKSFIHIEHGHFHDPVLNLYIQNMVQSSYPRKGLIEKLKRILSIGGEEHQGLDIGSLNHVAVMAAQRRDARGNKVQPLGVNRPGMYDHIEKSLWKKMAPLVAKYYTPYNWREKARETLERFYKDYPSMNIKAIVFGHTHVPDEHVITYKDRSALYLNSGDWNEPTWSEDPDTHHASFVILDANGNPVRGPEGNAVRDWIAENKRKTVEH